MKILMVTETLAAGGAEIFTARFCNELCEKHEVILFNIHPRLSQTSLIQALDKRVKLVSFHLPLTRAISKLDSFFYRMKLDSSLFRILLVKNLAALIESLKPDVVHSHLFKTDYYVSLAVAKVPYPVRHVLTVHGDYPVYKQNESVSRWLNIASKMNQILRSAYAVVCISSEQPRFFADHFAQSNYKTHFIYNGFKPLKPEQNRLSRVALGLSANGFMVGMVARGVEKKGWLKAIEAFIKADIKESYLVLVGGGEYLDKLAKKFSTTNIFFTGYSSDTLQYIRHFDVCLLPTLFEYESLPTVIMEYLYCGKPVIATDVGEIGKMLEEPSGRLLAGDLLKFKDQNIDVEELSRLLILYASNRDYLNQKKLLTERAFEKFDMNTCVHLYEGVYQCD